MTPAEAAGIAEEITAKYAAVYGRSNLQGCCLLIADEIAERTGGELVAGYLTWYGGSCRRTHWWVVLGEQLLDPMGEEFLAGETYPGRIESHRDPVLFRSLLPAYERWRIG